MTGSKKARFVASLVVGLVLMVLVVVAMWMSPPVSPALADTWATPQGASFGGGEWVMVPYINAVGVITGADQKYCGTEVQTAAYVLGDFQLIYDEHSSNIVTVTLEFSNDNTNWIDHMETVTPTVGNYISHTLTADVASWGIEKHLFGRYSRVCAVPSVAELFTVTVRAKVFN